MEYRAVGNRCAVVLDSLHLPISREKIVSTLDQKGFSVVNVDILSLARQCVAESKYRRGAKPSEAPQTVDCSSFVKWIYAQRGIWLPRRSIQQLDFGQPVDVDEVVTGDLVFVSSRIDYYHDDPSNGVGHVGMATGNGTVIHAANSKANVIESSVDWFIDGTKFRGARRYIPKGVEVLTLETPSDREVEFSDDIRWIILQSL